LVLTTVINGKIATRESVLQDGDEVKLVPYTGGG
ncbi:MAG: MoaD/ThiS family protein, partial [Anaerolineae bacterium]|nr:MoaD/ThiS family protein [Anaerolineae bacterium]